MNNILNHLLLLIVIIDNNDILTSKNLNELFDFIVSNKIRNKFRENNSLTKVFLPFSQFL